MAEEARQQEEAWLPVDKFGARMALVRNHLGLSVSRMAMLCGVSKQDWGRWERGASPRDERGVARKIADATGCDYTWLREGGPMSTGWNTYLLRDINTTYPTLSVVH